MSKKNHKSEKQQMAEAKERREDLRAVDRIMRKAAIVEDSFEQLGEDVDDLLEEVAKQFGTETQPFDDIDLVNSGVKTDYNRLLIFARAMAEIRKSIEEEGK